MFEMPPHVHLDDPLGRLLGHIDFRLAMLDGPTEDYTCFVGTMVQEAYATSDRIRAACEASINAYCEALAPDIQATIDLYGAPEVRDADARHPRRSAGRTEEHTSE